MFEINGKYTNAKVMIDMVEPECISQIQAMTNHAAFTNSIAIMPDTHAGKGSVIGFTMPVGDKIVPNVVGVDIGCGMFSVNVGKIDIDHNKVDSMIRDVVPFGKNVRNDIAKSRISGIDNLEYSELYKRVGIDESYALKSLGSLGGGNHFIEIGKDSNDNIWITVHTGSRNLGKKVCEYWQDKGFKRIVPVVDVDQIKSKFPKSEWAKQLKLAKDENKKYKKSDLDWIDGVDKEGYLYDMNLTQIYASVNRYIVMKEILKVFGIDRVYNNKDFIDTVHNFIDKRDNIIRKGAIRSYTGERMIIPFNMRDGILICEGKSNPEWNFSAPHGAGRLLSRSKAKEVLILEDYEKKMKGVFSTSINKFTLDEAPEAYKDSKMIEEAIVPTARIIDRIIPIHNLKDSEGKDE